MSPDTTHRESGTTAHSRSTTTRVLHVDDDAALAETAAAYLERADGVEVVTANRAENGLAHLAEERFDCVVSDYEMPGMDGIEFLSAVREDHPDVPFILFTGKGSEAIAAEAIATGATDYVQKGSGSDPFGLLANRVRNAVEQHRATRRAAELDRIRTLASDVTQALVRSSDRAAAERAVCDILSASDPYQFAWIGSHDPESDRLVPSAAAGDAAGALETVGPGAIDATASDVADDALREGRVAVCRDVDDTPEFAVEGRADVAAGVRAAAAVPLRYDGADYGVLVVYADRTDAFGEDERDLLADVGTDIAHALRSLEMRDQLRAERGFTDQALDALDDIFYVVGPDGSMRRWNDQLVEVTGYDEADVAEMEAVQFVPEDDRQAIRDALAGTLSDGRSTVEVDVLTADGDRIPHEFTGTRITGPDGEVTGIVGIGRDVTRRRERERALRREQERFSSLFESVPEPVVHVQFRDGEPVVRDVNAAFESVFGYDLATLEGECLDDYIVPDDRMESAETVNTRAMAGDELAREVRRKTVDGERTFLFRVVQVDTGRGRTEGVGMYVDITDRKRRERQLERKNERLDQFAGVVSHDLQNPLNVATGYLEEVRGDVDRHELDAVADALDRMETLIEDLLTIARSGHQVSDREPVDLATVAQGCWDNVSTAEATLVVEADPELRADPGRLKQLLENVFGNAVEHGEAGVTVTVGELPDGFFVADDGPGISVDERDAVFESGYTTTADGTGLGLSIVGEVARAHGWEVTLAESADGGARFEFTGVDDGEDGGEPTPE